jgi:hypothetical protein
VRMGKMALMDELPDKSTDEEGDDIDPVEYDVRVSLLTEVLRRDTPAGYALFKREAQELTERRRRSPHSKTPMPQPMPGAGSPPPRRDQSWAAEQVETPTAQGAEAPGDSEEPSPERVAELEARADAKVDRALAKPARLARS